MQRPRHLCPTARRQPGTSRVRCWARAAWSCIYQSTRWPVLSPVRSPSSHLICQAGLQLDTLSLCSDWQAHVDLSEECFVSM